MATASTKAQLVTKTAEGKTSTQNYNNVNPDATDSQIAAALTALAGLQKNELTEMRRVNTTIVQA